MRRAAFSVMVTGRSWVVDSLIFTCSDRRRT